MTKNVGTTDRNIRIVIAIVALIAALWVGVGSVLGVILIIVALIMAVTAFTGFCPIYRLLGQSTAPKPPAD
ncbi:MAG: DUF2892 domain-containing protein [Nostocoides sp.]